MKNRLPKTIALLNGRIEFCKAILDTAEKQKGNPDSANEHLDSQIILTSGTITELEDVLAKINSEKTDNFSLASVQESVLRFVENLKRAAYEANRTLRESQTIENKKEFEQMIENNNRWVDVVLDVQEEIKNLIKL